MRRIADLLFQAGMLKHIRRTGYAYLGAGEETTAEHSFIAAFIGYVMSELVPEADGRRLITMCLLHDLPEALCGDLNYVQRLYVETDLERAVDDTADGLSFGESMKDLIYEFENKETLEARLAHDADQLSLILDLKSLSDIGFAPPDSWIPSVTARLLTETGKTICEDILSRHRDAWWRKKLLTSKKERTKKAESYSSNGR